MKICAMNVHYRYFDLEYYFKSISEAGFKECEIWTSPHHFSVDYQSNDDINYLSKLSKLYDVEIVMICPEQTNPKPHNIAERDPKKQIRVLQYFSRMIDLAHDIGCGKLVITSGWAFYNEDKDDAYKRSVEMMKRICEYAQMKEVTLALEALQPEESTLVNTINDIEKYRYEVSFECLKVCLDMGAMARASETIDMYFSAFGNDIIHVHFVDGNPTGHLAWGDGNRNINEDISSFERNGYKHYLSLENANSRYFEIPVETDRNSIKLFMDRTEVNQ